MNKESVVRELFRDLKSHDAEGVRKSLAKSGWIEKGFQCSMTKCGFYGHLHVIKDGLKLYFFFTDEGLNSIQTE